MVEHWCEVPEVVSSILTHSTNGAVAQLVEHRTENPSVASSILARTTPPIGPRLPTCNLQVKVVICRNSSIGRVWDFQSQGCGFETRFLLHTRITQLVRVVVLFETIGRWFESIFVYIAWITQLVRVCFVWTVKQDRSVVRIHLYARRVRGSPVAKGINNLSLSTPSSHSGRLLCLCNAVPKGHVSSNLTLGSVFRPKVFIRNSALHASEASASGLPLGTTTRILRVVFNDP